MSRAQDEARCREDPATTALAILDIDNRAIAIRDIGCPMRDPKLVLRDSLTSG
jgi:hypothetical protein